MEIALLIFFVIICRILVVQVMEYFTVLFGTRFLTRGLGLFSIEITHLLGVPGIVSQKYFLEVEK